MSDQETEPGDALMPAPGSEVSALVPPKEETGGASAADAAEHEATGKTTVLQIPLGDGGELNLTLPKRWKRFKFMRRMAAGEIWGAIEAMGFDDEQLQRLEDADIAEEEFKSAVRAFADSLTGKDKDADEGKPQG